MANAQAAMIKSHFENQLLGKIGETVTLYRLADSTTFNTDGYITDRTDPAGERILVRVSTLTEKDGQFFDLGHIDVDDHKLYSQVGDGVQEHDELTRDDNERYEVLGLLHKGSVGGVDTFNTHLLRRRKTVS